MVRSGHCPSRAGRATAHSKQPAIDGAVSLKSSSGREGWLYTCLAGIGNSASGSLACAKLLAPRTWIDFCFDCDFFRSSISLLGMGLGLAWILL